MGKNLEIRAIMLGGRRTGKTSVLAGMVDCYERDVENLVGINLTSPDKDTLKTLEEQSDKISLYFSQNKNTPKLPFVPKEISLSSGKKDNYYFDLSLDNKKCDKITLTFSDLKGEVMDEPTNLLLELNAKFDDENKKNKMLIDFLFPQKANEKNKTEEESSILMICIDTPHLLEEDGEYSNRKNKIKSISNAVKTFIAESKIKNKLVLFIPTKCEYCFDKNNQDRNVENIYDKVKEEYRIIIEKMKKDCLIAIIPALTIGTINFVDFKKDHGAVIKDNDELPEFPRYKYVLKDEKIQKYSPQNLDLIILFILYYILTFAKENKEEQKKDFWKNFFPNVFDYFKEKFGDFASTEDFMMKLDEIKKQIKEKENFYDIISDPMEIFGNNKKKENNNENNNIDEILKTINRLNRFL